MIKTVALIGLLSISMSVYHFVAPVPQAGELDGLWASWKVQYNKAYSTQDEDSHRFDIFLQNREIVLAHNANPENTYTMALTKFADLTVEEFKATYATLQPNEDASDPYCPFDSDGCPSWPATDIQTVNWTAKGAVTPIKNQGQCGGCWSFSTTGALEGLYFLNNSKLLSFSEQQILDCDTSCSGCGGCQFIDWFAYPAQYGSQLESEYPFVGKDTKCKYNASQAIKVNPSGGQCIPQKSVADLQAAVATQPVSISVEAGQNAWQLYDKGILNTGCGAQLDHAVTLIGYGPYEGSSSNVWYVKNQWGTDWGVDGYVYISQNAQINDGFGVCGILRCTKIPLNKPSN